MSDNEELANNTSEYIDGLVEEAKQLSRKYPISVAEAWVEILNRMVYK